MWRQNLPMFAGYCCAIQKALNQTFAIEFAIEVAKEAGIEKSEEVGDRLPVFDLIMKETMHLWTTKFF